MSDPAAPRDDEISRRRLLEASAAAAAVTLVGGAALPALAATPTVPLSHHIVTRLRAHGATRLFGVPGATCDPLYDAAMALGLPVVVTSSDLEAGYAADGFARVAGLGAVAVTYGVGTLGILSVIGGAYAERSPIVVVNGGPSADDLRIQRELGSSFSHSTGKDGSDLAMFREVTAFAERIERAEDGPRVVGAALLAASRTRRPVYVEVPKHLWDAPVPAADTTPLPAAPVGSEGELADQVNARLRAGKRPAVLVGAEVARFGLQDAVLALLQRLGVPWATTLLGKGALGEAAPGFVGVYGGRRSAPAARAAIEGADALLAIGCVFGRQYRGLVTERPERLTRIDADGVRFGVATPRPGTLPAVLAALQTRPWTAPAGPRPTRSAPSYAAAAPASPERGLTFDQVLLEVDGLLSGSPDAYVVLSDTSLSMTPAMELPIPTRGGYLCNGVWQAIGWSVGAAAGVGLASGKRPLVVCGDGGFQMTAQALSTLARHKVPAVVIVLDNGLYGIEQWLLAPGYFDRPTGEALPHLPLNRWDYAALGRALGLSTVATVADPGALRAALAAAHQAAGPALIAAAVRPHDLPAACREQT